MRKLLIIALLIVGCEETTEPKDCAGVEDGDSILDECGICDSDSSNDCIQDCKGVWGGNADIDECGVCDGNGYMVSKLFNLEFAIIERKVTSNSLIVHGNVKYIGTTMVGFSWYIEGEFYSDNNYTIILGNASELINGIIVAGETFNWTLSFSSNDFIESEYPDFGFKNLAGYILTCP